MPEPNDETTPGAAGVEDTPPDPPAPGPAPAPLVEADHDGADARRRALLDGPLDAAIVRLAVPLLFGYLAQLGFGYVDTYFVGLLGKDALAAVGSTLFMSWAMVALTEVASIGTLALVARAVGQGDGLAAGRALLAGLALALALGAGMGAGGALTTPLVVAATGLEPAPGALAGTYLATLWWGYPSLALFLVLEAALRGAGDTRTPMAVLAVTFVLNAVLDPLLIFGLGPFPALGVFGAALATVLARLAGVLALAVLLRRRARALGLRWPGWSLRAPDGDLLPWRLVRIGAPSSAASLGFCAIYLVLVRLTAGHGTAAVAALGVGLRLEGLAFIGIQAIGRAAATIAGQALGAGRPERAHAAARRALRLACLAVAPLAAVMALAPEVCVRVLVDDPTVVVPAAAYLRAASWALFPLAFEIVLENVAAGAGDTVPVMAIELVGTLLRIPIALGLEALGCGYHAVWWAVALTVLLKGAAFEVWFRGKKWG